jgi:hypothetical protein
MGVLNALELLADMLLVCIVAVKVEHLDRVVHGRGVRLGKSEALTARGLLTWGRSEELVISVIVIVKILITHEVLEGIRE